jgi:hypothetical protein
MIEEEVMASVDTEGELQHPTSHRERAAELRRQAERLGRAGYRDQAARQLLEARLHDLKALAASATSRAA